MSEVSNEPTMTEGLPVVVYQSSNFLDPLLLYETKDGLTTSPLVPEIMALALKDMI